MVMPEKSRRPEASAKKRTPLHLLPALSPFRGRREDAPRPQASLRQELQAAVRTARNGWLFLISLCVIVIVTTAGISHVDLLLNRPVKLPIVQVGMPVSAYFFFTPLFLLAVHAEVLLRHADVARKAKALLETGETTDCHALPQYHILGELACTSAGQKWIYRVIHILTLVILPLLTLLYVQSAYLPLHDPKLTWWHRALITLDAAFLWLYLRLLYGQTLKNSSVALLSALPAIFAIFIATIPEEWTERIFCSENSPLRWSCTPVPYGVADPYDTHRKAFWPTAWLYEGDVNDATGRLNSLLARNLVILNHDLAGKDANAPRLNLRNRDLRYANFSGSNLRRADFTASNMTGAKLVRADLRDALFGCARTGTPASLLPRRQSPKSRPEDEICWQWKSEHKNEKCTILKKADLSYADLRGSTIGDAYLERATLVGSQLQSQKFNNACLFMADMSEADISKATFERSILVGSLLEYTNFTNARFFETDLSLSNIKGANLQKTTFNQTIFTTYNDLFVFISDKYIDFKGTFFASILDEADLRCADFSYVSFLASSLNKVKIWNTNPPEDVSAHFGLPARDKGGLEFSIVKDIQISPKGAICSKENSLKPTHKENWWKEASHLLSKLPKNWQHFIAEALCHNYTYFKALPRRLKFDWIDPPPSFEWSLPMYKIIRPTKDYRLKLKPKLNLTINSQKNLLSNNKNNKFFIPYKKYDTPYIDPIVIWHRVQRGNCPAAEKLTNRQKMKLKEWAEKRKAWLKKQKSKGANGEK